MNTKEKAMNILNNELLANNMFYFYERYQDEKDYEDPSEYKKVIEKSVKEEISKLSGITFKKASIKPFGFTIDINSKQFIYKVKVKGRYISMVMSYKG